MRRQQKVADEKPLGDEEAALVELTNRIMQAAIAERASDIHVDPVRNETKVRYRVDAVMRDVLTLPLNVHDPLVTRFKTLADLDTANRRAIQTGRIFVSHEGREYDMRETVLPTVYGEKLTLRMWGEEYSRITFDRIGLSGRARERLERCLHAVCGLLVFSGPTGCGKTTVMHAAMLHLASPERTLYSVEDPVEIRLPGIVQTSVNRKVGIDYSEALRGILRSDPDVVMVGELPDADTINECLDAAMTGHLVMTTLHAEDAASAVRRLLQMGSNPFLLSQGLLMVSSQRLVRRICGECKGKATYPAEMIAAWRERAEAGGLAWPDKPPVFHRGKGCEACLHTGYRGRMIIYEILVMDEELQAVVGACADASQIREAAIKKGMTTMFADGMAKAIAGETTAEEVVRVHGG